MFFLFLLYEVFPASDNHNDRGGACLGSRLVERLSMQGSVDSGSEWHEVTLTTDSVTTSKTTTSVTAADGAVRTPRVAYRLLCDAGYYGRRCSLSCNARHDKFGHYVCSDNGTRVCLDGWSGSFCDVRAYIIAQSFLYQKLSSWISGFDDLVVIELRNSTMIRPRLSVPDEF